MESLPVFGLADDFLRQHQDIAILQLDFFNSESVKKNIRQVVARADKGNIGEGGEYEWRHKFQSIKITRARASDWLCGREGVSAAGGNGFEPLLIDPESIVLPLDEPPILVERAVF